MVLLFNFSKSSLWYRLRMLATRASSTATTTSRAVSAAEAAKASLQAPAEFEDNSFQERPSSSPLRPNAAPAIRKQHCPNSRASQTQTQYDVSQIWRLSDVSQRKLLLHALLLQGGRLACQRGDDPYWTQSLSSQKSHGAAPPPPPSPQYHGGTITHPPAGGYLKATRSGSRRSATSSAS